MPEPNENILAWNVHGLNSPARRDLLRTVVSDEHASLVAVVEIKLDVIDDWLILQLFGRDVGYYFLPMVGTHGGILVAWRANTWEVSDVVYDTFALSIKVKDRRVASAPWWLTVVYGPFPNADRLLFFEELRAFCAVHPGPWAIIGDFNLIYQATDKNNQNLDRRWMNRFRCFLEDLELREFDLHGRRYTWSNERRQPMLVRLDRWFHSGDWDELFPNCLLRAGTSLASDHCPILLHSNLLAPRCFRFRFEALWTKFDSYL